MTPTIYQSLLAAYIGGANDCNDGVKCKRETFDLWLANNQEIKEAYFDTRDNPLGTQQVVGAVAMRNYDDLHQIGSDAYADFEAEQLHEGCKERFGNKRAIGIYPTPRHDRVYYVDSREARVLAANLEKSADECDAAIARGDRVEERKP